MSQNNINENYDSDEYSEDNDYEKYIYDAEEKSKTKYNIVLCEIYNYRIFGKPLNNELNSHYIVIHRFKQFNKHYIDGYIDECVDDLLRLRECYKKHIFIRNYRFIMNKIKPEIAECIYLETGECVCILKTFWIRLIQKTWKKIYFLKKDLLRKRCHINSLLYKERNGRWPFSCFYLPSIVGMMSR